MNPETTQDLVLPTRPPTAEAPFAPLVIERAAMDLGTVIRAARRGAAWIGAAAAAGLVLGGLATMALPKTYESYAAVRVNSYVVDDLTQSGRNATGNDNGLELEAVSDEVLSLAGNSVTPAMSARDVRRSIEVSQVGNDSVLELVVTTNDAERSAELVNAVADAMLALRVDEVQLGLDEASVSLQSEIKRLELELVDLNTQLDTDRDPALSIQRDTVDQQLSLLTEIEIRSRQDSDVSAAPDILTEIELLEAELAGIDERLAGETDLGLNVSRDSVASQLSLLTELQVRSDLYSALPGEVLRAGLVPTSAAGIGWQANGVGLALVFAGIATLVLTIQERKLISLRDLANLVGPPIAKLPRIPVLEGAGLDAEEFDALDAPLHRLDLWVRVRRDQRTLFVSAGSAPAASALIQQLAFHRAGNGATQVVDFEKEVFGVGLDAIVNTGVRLRSVADLHPDATVDSLLIVSPSLEVSSNALEAALVSDDVVLVVDTATVTFESVQTALEALATVGVSVTGSVVLEGR